ncbi:DUF4232 domain-containing protein [Streptomyces sp. NPDC086787]|uniref:DUF4232 domain-containing protein n=1 Tax=Streptomyces sp. NPDC086787 TaxID=3365759 RepID=UPI00381EEE6C
MAAHTPRPLRTTCAAVTAVAAAAVLVLTGCGRETTGAPGAAGTGPGCPSAGPRDGTPKDGVRITSLSGTASGHGKGCGTGVSSVAFSVTNASSTPMTYTVTLGFRSASGGAVSTVTKTVTAVPPGRTVTATAAPGELPPTAPRMTDVSIEKVRGIPTAETPSSGGSCPPSGVHLYADQGDAAMGLRVVSLHLENCGTHAYRLNGRPTLQILDAGHDPVPGVRIVRGEDIATATGADGTPRPLTLNPGERAYAVLTWRNTTEAGNPVNAPYTRVWAKPGARPVVVTPELDLGTTGRLGVGPWKRATDTGR